MIKDVYRWNVIYDDNSGVPESKAESFTNVDKARVHTLELRTDWSVRAHRVEVPKGAEPVFFRRRTIVVNPSNGLDEPPQTVHCIGWKRAESATYLFVFDDGSTLLSSDLQAV